MASEPYREALPRPLSCAFCQVELPAKPVLVREGVRVCAECNWRRAPIAELQQEEQRLAALPVVYRRRQRRSVYVIVGVLVVLVGLAVTGCVLLSMVGRMGE